MVTGISGLMILGLASSEAAQYHVTYAYGGAGYSYLDMYVAEDMGFLKQEGIEFKTSVVGGSSTAAAGTIGGSFDFFVAVPVSANQAIEHGRPLIHFAVTMAQYGPSVVVSKEVADKYKLTKNTPLPQRIQALKGLRITSVGPNVGPDLLLRYIAKREGWNPDREMTLLPLGGPPALAAFANQRVDAIAQSSPTADIAIKKYGGFMLLDLNHGDYPPLKDYPGGTLVANTNWLWHNKEAAAAVVRALWHAMEFLHDHPNEAKAVLRKRFKNVDDDTFNAGFEANLVATPRTPEINRQIMQRPIDFANFLNKEPLKTSVDKTFTGEIVKLAAEGMKRK